VRIVITGATGRLGSVVCTELRTAQHEIITLGRADLDVTRPEEAARVIGSLDPDAVVNCASYNAVDAAENDRATAFAINAHGTGLLAAATAAAGALFVHFSSDFVFDGDASHPYRETDQAKPLSVYGESKLAGEREAQRAPRHYVLRVASLFGGTGVNGHRATVDYIADNLLAGTPVRVAVDRTVTPSYVPDVARVSRIILERRIPYGTYHCVNSGSATWYELAQEISRQLGVDGGIEPVLAADLKTIAARPRSCALSNQKLASSGIVMPTWCFAIRRHLISRQAPTVAAATPS
jgi:dTDP-4-dehydrorhamnose reductase